MRFFCDYGWCCPNDTAFYLLITYSCLLSASFRFLSRNYLVITSIPIHYHPVLSPYFATYLSAFIRWVSPASTPSTKKTHQNAIFFAQSKIIHYLCRRIENMINKKSIRLFRCVNIQSGTLACRSFFAYRVKFDPYVPQNSNLAHVPFWNTWLILHTNGWACWATRSAVFTKSNHPLSGRIQTYSSSFFCLAIAFVDDLSTDI